MEETEWKSRVANATVRLPDKGGLGVLVPGGFVATATHCIDWDGTGAMALGDVFLSTVICADGTTFRLAVVAADPVSDMAVLGALDEQEAPDEVERFEEWQERVTPIPLKRFTLGWQESCPVFVLTHEGRWVDGKLTRYNPEHQPMSCCLALDVTEGIKGGTSGGPIVSQDGELVGVMSLGGGVSNMTRPCPSVMPVAHLTLPRWVLDRIARASLTEPGTPGEG